MEYSISPRGDKIPLPQQDEYALEFEKLSGIVTEQKALGKEIVVVMGLGFVGAVMAAVIADSVDKQTGVSQKFVISMQRPSTRSYWKISTLNTGLSPVKAEDPDVDILIRRCVLERKNLMATYTYDVLKLADIVVVDVQCDFLKEELGNCTSGRAEIAALEESMKIVAQKIRPECLVLIETTVPPGTTEYIAYPV